MATTEIKCICKKCNIEFSAIPKRSFLGFQKVICPSTSCNTKLIYPLTSGYRTAYWILLVLMLLSFVGELSEGRVGFPGGIGIALIFALFKDRSIKKNTCEIEKESTIWKKLGFTVAFIAILVVGVIVREVGTHAVQNINKENNEKEINKAILDASAEINKNLPLMVDKETRLDATVALGKSLTYSFTLINAKVSEIDQSKFKEIIQGEITKKVCTSPDMKVFVENNVDVIYSYHDSDGLQIASVKVQSPQCKALKNG